MGEIKKGKFIVLEGTDGSGKETQAKKLLSALRKYGRRKGLKIRAVSFPSYGKPWAFLVEAYLRGELGGLNAKAASMLFMGDRLYRRRELLRWLEEGCVVVADRYVASNMGHQGAKLKSPDERSKLFLWLNEMEFGACELPKPDLNIILHVPAEVAYELIEKKKKRKYLRGAKRDVHEKDLAHIQKAERAYQEVVEHFPDDFAVVECARKGKMLSIEEIHEKVWKLISPLVAKV